MKKVLFISPQPFFQWRGSPIRVRFVLQALSELGYEVDLLTLPFGEDIELKNVNIIRVPNIFNAKDVPIGPSAMKAVFDLVIIYYYFRHLRGNKYDVIHGIEEGGFIALMLGKLYKAKTVFEKHSDPFSHRKGFIRNLILSVYASIEKFTIRRVGLIIGTGSGLADQAKRMGPKGDVAAIFDIPSSLVEATEEEAEILAKELKQSPDEQIATFVGSFAVYQGIDLLFNSIPEVLKLTPHMRFMIIGGSDEEINERKAALEELGIVQQVSFLGRIAPDELPPYLKASDILLAPRSSGVNTPLKILDYFKAGRPIVATNVASNRLILNEATAVFAEPNAEDYASKISKLASDAALQKHMGKNSTMLYQEKYNFQAFKLLLENAYNSLFKKS